MRFAPESQTIFTVWLALGVKGSPLVGVSMKRFESRPARQGFWEYYFYIDLIGHQNDPAPQAALIELQANSAFFKVAGSYPRAR